MPQKFFCKFKNFGQVEEFPQTFSKSTSRRQFFKKWLQTSRFPNFEMISGLILFVCSESILKGFLLYNWRRLQFLVNFRLSVLFYKIKFDGKFIGKFSFLVQFIFKEISLIKLKANFQFLIFLCLFIFKGISLKKDPFPRCPTPDFA